MLCQWHKLTNYMMEKRYNVDGVCHDIVIDLIGKWQRAFV